MKTGDIGTDPHPRVEERLLIEAAREDPRRFADLYESHFDGVYAFSVSRLRDRDAAEDVTAEVFHRALAFLPRFEWRGVPFAAWLRKIASNVIADRLRRTSRERSWNEGDEPSASQIEEVEQRTELYRLVHRLPADQRRVVQMRFAQEKSIREISHVLGRTEGAVKQLQFRALKNLKAFLGEIHG